MKNFFPVIGLIGIIFFIFFLISACGNMSSSTVPNDWDADGDSFDRGDMDAYFEFKANQDKE